MLRAPMLAALVLALGAMSVGAVTLSVRESEFLLDGKPSFLLGISYYGGAGASEEFVRSDLEALVQHGFNWIRVWATWTAYENDISAVDRTGGAREPYLSKLKSLVAEADRRGMVVDVTLSRGEALPDQAAHLRAVETLARALKPWRNVYIDLANERNIRDARFVSFEELGALRDKVKKIDAGRLVTASQGGDISREDLRRYLKQARVDFITPHRPRNSKSPGQTAERTRQYLDWMRDLGKVVPVHYQEPFRRDYGKWQPKAQDFLDDLREALRGGAAGWCLHNGGPRGRGYDRPRRSFDLRPGEGALMKQLDAEEMQVVERAAQVVRQG